MGTGGIALSRTAAMAVEDEVHGRIAFHVGHQGTARCDSTTSLAV